MRKLLVAVAAVVAACATVVTPARIAADLGDHVAYLRGWPLSAQCQAVEDASARCVAAGYDADCAWRGLHQADDVDWLVRACRARATGQR